LSGKFPAQKKNLPPPLDYAFLTKAFALTWQLKPFNGRTAAGRAVRHMEFFPWSMSAMGSQSNETKASRIVVAGVPLRTKPGVPAEEAKMENTMKNILIVDNDLGFILWLGRALIAAHQQPLPACNVSDAMVLVREPAAPVDLLIINSSLPHSSELISLLRRSQAKLKVIALGAEGKVKLPHIHAWHRKPGHTDQSAEKQWLEAVENLLVKRPSASGAAAHRVQ
jgi:hypothetical protein